MPGLTPQSAKPFRNRADAGRQLGRLLAGYAGRSDVIVLGLPRGGIPVAHEVAARLEAPLDVFLVRKLGVPGHPELAMGAIAEGGIEVLSRDLIRDLGIPHALVEQVAVRERLELDRRDALYRGGRRPAAVRDRTVILVDDGLATGSTMEAAIWRCGSRRPRASSWPCRSARARPASELRAIADEVVCVATPEPFNAVGLWYEEFSQTTDEEVKRLLAGAASERLAQTGVAQGATPRGRRARAGASAQGRSGAVRRACSRASAMRASCCSARRRTARTSSTASARSSRGG